MDLGFPLQPVWEQEVGIPAEIKGLDAGCNVQFNSKICANGDDTHPRGSG